MGFNQTGKKVKDPEELYNVLYSENQKQEQKAK
jgi:hypothetical protein